jgi:hypothetical protein
MEKKYYLVKDVEWDVDDDGNPVDDIDLINLVEIVEVEVDDDGEEESVVDILTDKYGYLIINCNMVEIDMDKHTKIDTDNGYFIIPNI